MLRNIPPIASLVGFHIGLIWGDNSAEAFVDYYREDSELMVGFEETCEELGVPVPDMGLVAQEFEIQGEAFRERARLEIAEAERRAIEQLEDRLDYEHFVRTHWYP
jgi:hypothetical protein